MPFQVQDVTQGLACVGQLTLQRPRLLWGAFLVTEHVAFQRVQKQLNAFLDAGQLRQGLVLFMKFLALKCGFVEPHGGVTHMQKPLFQPRKLIGWRCWGVAGVRSLGGCPPGAQASQHQGRQTCNCRHVVMTFGSCRRGGEARGTPIALRQKTAHRSLWPHALPVLPTGLGGSACAARPKAVSHACAWP